MPRSHPPLWLAALAAWYVALGIGPRASAEEQGAPTAGVAAADSSTDLGPTSAIPWNPPRPVPTHEPWEQVINAPLTLVSLPIRALGALTEKGLLRVQEDRLVPKVQYGIAVTARSGLLVGPPGTGDASGFGAALGYAPPFLRGWLRASLSGTFRHYHHGSLELGPPWLSAAYVHDWRPEEQFYGIGAHSREMDNSNYAMQAEQVDLRLKLRAGSRVRRDLVAWLGERRSVQRSGRETGAAGVEATFPALVAGRLDVSQRHWVTGARVGLDARSGRPHWSRGWRLAAEAERFAAVRGGDLGFAGTDDSPGFHRFTLAGQVGWSFMRDPRTLRLAARIVDVEPLDDPRPPMVYDLSRLGASAGLAGFEPGRFHDLDLLVAQLDYIFPLVEYAELQLTSEIGAVSGDVWRDTRLDRLERSYGVTLRFRSHSAPLAALGVHWSHESTRVNFSFGGVE